jgi:putative DNA primase/helicase
VILSGEDTRDVVLSRGAAAGGDCGRIHVVRPALDDMLGARPRPATEERLLLPRDLSRLRDLLERTGARLLIIDPLVAFLDKSVQWHMDQSIRRVLLALAQIAEELGAGIVLIRHLNKQAHLKAIYRGSGSIALIGNARAGLLVVADPERPERRLLVSQKSNLCPSPLAARYELRSAGASVAVAWLDECPLDADGLSFAPLAPEETQAVAEAMAFLQDYLRQCAVPANYVIREAKLTGISEKTLRRAKYKLGVISRIFPYSGGGGDRWAWELPKAAKAPPPPG